MKRRSIIFALYALLASATIVRPLDGDEAVDVPKAVSEEFKQLDTNSDGVLETNELAFVLLEADPDWNNADIQNLPGYRDLAIKSALKRVDDEFAFYFTSPTSNPPLHVVTLANFVLYRQRNPKPHAGGAAASPSGPPSPKEVSAALPTNLHLTKSSTVVKDETAPAQFGWTGAKGQKPVYTVDAALSYSIVLNSTGTSYSEIDPTVEAHTSSDPKATQNSISIKTPYWVVGNMGYLSIGPDWERDMIKNTETLGGTIEYTYDVDALAVGRMIQLFGESYPSFLWRPYIGIEAGHAYDSGGTAAFASTNNFDRLFGYVHLELAISERFLIAGDYYHRQSIDYGSKAYDYVEISPTYQLGSLSPGKGGNSSHYSVGVTYKNGRTTPSFSDVDSLNLWLGIKF